MKSCLVAVSIEDWTMENEGLLSLLSDREIKALRLYGSKQELAASLVGYTLAKSLIRFRFHREGELKRSQGGKPFLDAPGWEGDFSVSHSGGVVAVAVTSSGKIGVDVEKVRPVMEELIPECLAEGEREEWREAVTEESRRGLFFRYWTLKEAYLKYTGAGIGEVSLCELNFSGRSRTDEDRAPKLQGEESFPHLAGNQETRDLCFSHYALSGGYSLAVCGEERSEVPEWLAPLRTVPRKPSDTTKRLPGSSAYRKVPGLWSSLFS